jgi:hypothetical protein
LIHIATLMGAQDFFGQGAARLLHLYV